MRFVPQFTDGQEFPHPLGKVVCIGRNYADHAKELDNPVPTEPLLFIKPSTSVVISLNRWIRRFHSVTCILKSSLRCWWVKP